MGEGLQFNKNVHNKKKLGVFLALNLPRKSGDQLLNKN